MKLYRPDMKVYGPGVKYTVFDVNYTVIGRLYSGKGSPDNFFVISKFLSLEICKWFSNLCWFQGYKNFGPIAWDFDFEKFGRILKLRGLNDNAWAVSNKN